jgi:hypothetical protein
MNEELEACDFTRDERDGGQVLSAEFWVWSWNVELGMWNDELEVGGLKIGE